MNWPLGRFRVSKCQRCSIVQLRNTFLSLHQILRCVQPNYKTHAFLPFLYVFLCMFFHIFMWLFGYTLRILWRKIFKSKVVAAQKKYTLRRSGTIQSIRCNIRMYVVCCILNDVCCILSPQPSTEAALSGPLSSWIEAWSTPTSPPRKKYFFFWGGGAFWGTFFGFFTRIRTN